MLVAGLTGALQGLAFVGSDGRGWKAVPVLGLVGVLCGLGLWTVAHKPAAKPRPRARQTFVRQLIDLCLLLLIAPLVLAAMAIAIWGGLLFLLKVVE